jgi:hypothetical protein
MNLTRLAPALLLALIAVPAAGKDLILGTSYTDPVSKISITVPEPYALEAPFDDGGTTNIDIVSSRSFPSIVSPSGAVCSLAVDTFDEGGVTLDGTVASIVESFGSTMAIESRTDHTMGAHPATDLVVTVAGSLIGDIKGLFSIIVAPKTYAYLTCTAAPAEFEAALPDFEAIRDGIVVP